MILVVVIGLLLFVIVCELAAIYDRQDGGKWHGKKETDFRSETFIHGKNEAVFSSLANAAGHIGELYADFVQSDEVRNSMRATADKVTECMDGIRELNELEGQLETEKQESEDKI